MSEHSGMSYRTRQVVFNQFDVKADTRIEACDRGMERGFKPLAPSCLFCHSSG
jgi:hypothetical protein